MFNFKKLEMMNLENLNLVELNAQELITVEGGKILSHIIDFLKGLATAIF